MELPVVNCSKHSYVDNQSVCALGYWDGKPTPQTCRLLCPQWSLENKATPKQAVEVRPKKWYDVFKQHRGVGDTVKWFIEVVSFGRIKQKKGCGCKQRQSWLNRKFPYRWS